MYAETTISEYKNRTILVLFSYPIKRERLIAAKMFLISVFTAISIFFGFLCSLAYLVFMDAHFDALLDNVTGASLWMGLLKAAEQTVLGVILTMIPFAVGMLKRSSSASIVSAVVLVVLMQPVMGRSPSVGEFIIKTLCVLIVAVSASAYALRCSTHHVDL